MPEKFTKAERSRIMAAIKSRDTTPELVVRRIVHALGYRYRLHVRSLPGTPDIVLPRQRKIINIHGCFWHNHTCQRRRKPPKSNAAYWRSKIAGNVQRDRLTARRLRRLGWKILILWECQTRDSGTLEEHLKRFLKKPHSSASKDTEKIKPKSS